MASDPAKEVYDLLILVDATYSMFNYLEALKISLPRVIAISNLTTAFERIGLLAYRDYSEANRSKDGILEWSGWYDSINPQAKGNVAPEALMSCAAALEPIGGGDYPEATKTGLARAYELMRGDAITIVLLYTDAPPHCYMVADRDQGSNYHAEQAALSATKSYGGYGPYFMDWVSACKQLHAGPKKARVFSFLDENLASLPLQSGYYTYLSTITRGACLSLTDATPHNIAQITIDVLLAWMGVEKAGVENTCLPAKLIRYKHGQGIKQIKTENDPQANIFFWAHSAVHKAWMGLSRKQEDKKTQDQMADHRAKIDVDTNALKKHLPKRATPMKDFARRYAEDAAFQIIVVGQLKSIIETDVSSMSLNPVFGTLWRAVCNDRDNPARDQLVSMFGYHVEKIADEDEKQKMKNWLEESYDYAAEIQAMLNAVPQDQQFPCVFLDPTINFGRALEKNEEKDDEDRPNTAFRRDELLEIGRSCDGRILRRLGKVLTRLTFVESGADLPEHIASTSNKDVPKIPLVLASQENGRKLFKILLHVVLPGTMLSARASTVLAALAIRIGLKPLFDVAADTMLFWREKWNDLEVPETWNASCLGLLLDADAEYHKQNEATPHGANDTGEGLLLASDRELFSQLVTYHHTGANLHTILSAQIGWTPEKTKVSVGPIVLCRGCGIPRSVTIMAEKSGGKCGLCMTQDWKDIEQKERCMTAHVTREDTEQTKATWVECSVRTCRAQYVCYNPSDLNVRPKCHYCRLQPRALVGERNGYPAPTLECVKCLNRVIWPKEYRTASAGSFQCYACVANCKTIVSVETSADRLSIENGMGWLLKNVDGVLKEPFKRSMYHAVTTVGPDVFVANIGILPKSGSQSLTIRGKIIHNELALKENLETWILRRTSEKTLCSLCFDSFPYSRLLPACRRHGCNQRICESCLQSWYGLNGRGIIINTSSLFCPFCRRPPAAQTLRAYGLGIHAVGDLKAAVDERGQWIHAWCWDCGKARRHMERQCVRGAPDPVTKWKCEDCSLSALEKARLAENQARQVLARGVRMSSSSRAEAQRQLRLAEQHLRELECPVKDCPGCKIPTQKSAGCDHMECPVCNTHWCWSCGEKDESGDIYDHLARVHGGFYTGGFGLAISWET